MGTRWLRRSDARLVSRALQIAKTMCSFLLRCLGPCDTYLQPTELKTIPDPPYPIDGELLDIGKRVPITQPANAAGRSKGDGQSSASLRMRQ